MRYVCPVSALLVPLPLTPSHLSHLPFLSLLLPQVDPVVRPAKKGTEVTFLSTLLDASGEPVWSNASTYLILHKQPKEVRDAIKKDPPSTEPESEPVLESSWKLGGSMGVRYAAVSKDNNPIHTMPLMAKAFGFPNVIMHGM